MKVYSRQEVLSMTGLSSGCLSRLDKSKIVVPTKIGSKTHPNVIYNDDQLLDLRLIATIKDKVTPSELKNVVDSYRDRDRKLPPKNVLLVIRGKTASWLLSEELAEYIVTVSNTENSAVMMKVIPVAVTQ